MVNAAEIKENRNAFHSKIMKFDAQTFLNMLNDIRFKGIKEKGCSKNCCEIKYRDTKMQL